MESVLERITKNHFHKFAGGIHPPEQKFLTNDKPIKTIALAEQLILPLKQHIGKPGDILVSVGDKVLKGQQLTKNGNPMSVPIHAPTSGTIKAIKPSVIAHASGMSDLCVFLTPDGEDKWRKRAIVEDYKQLSKVEIIDKIAYAGIAGMGGAGFPTNIKVNVKPGIKTLIINAAECEPYITADDLLIRERSSAIVNGIDILDYLLEPEFILIGIEDNKPLAIAALKKATEDHQHVHVCVLPTKYPTGGEKQLIKALTGKEVPSGVLPLALGIVMQNVATVFAISEAIINDTPLIRRVVTVTGQALKKPQNLWVPIGTPVEHLLNQCGFTKSEKQRIIMGGPLMGFTLPSLNIPVVKTTNCILAPTQTEISTTSKELECIRCGQCAEVCPSTLLPQELQWYAKAKDYDKLEELNLFDCIDCGACAYVCPSQIPLVQYYRVAKAEIRQNKIQEVKSERAKVRFEARKVRLEKDKIAREEKHKKAIEARKKATSPVQEKANTSAVAAALARVKAKKAALSSTPETTKDSSASTDVKNMAAQAIARAKAKKKAKAENIASLETDPVNTDAVKTSSPANNEAPIASDAQQQVEAKKARTAAAIAKAKAKKLAQPTRQNSQAPSVDIAPETVNGHQKTEVQQPSFTELIKSEPTAAEIKKARTAAAIAKAKAKKMTSDDASAFERQTSLTADLKIDLEESIEDFINKEPTDKELAKAKQKLAVQGRDSEQLQLLESDSVSAELKAELKNEAKSEQKTTANPIVKSTVKPVAKATAKPVAKTTANTTSETMTKPAAKPAAKPVAKTAAKATTKPAAKPVAKAAAKTTTKPAAKPATKAAAKTTAKTTAKPAAKPVAKAAAKTTTKPAAKPATKAAAKTTANTTAKPAAKPATKAAAKTTAKTTAKPAAKPVAKAAAKTTTKSAAKPATKAAAKTTAKTTAKPAAKPVAKAAAKTTAKPAAKPVAKAAAKTTTKSAAKPVAKAAAKTTAKTTAKPAAKQVAKAAAKTTTKPAAKPATKAAAKPATKAAAKPAAKSAAKTVKKSPSKTIRKVVEPETKAETGVVDRASEEVIAPAEFKNDSKQHQTARVKANAQNINDNKESPNSPDEMSDIEKKAKISAAVAKAKAKLKKQQLKESK